MVDLDLSCISLYIHVASFLKFQVQEKQQEQCQKLQVVNKDLNEKITPTNELNAHAATVNNTVPASSVVVKKNMSECD